LESNLKFESQRWEFVSDEAKEFVSGLLAKDATARPTAQEALESPWIKQYASKEPRH
jgi:serine/threonine protein kinase